MHSFTLGFLGLLFFLQTLVESHDILGFSRNKNGCSISNNQQQSLVFVFDDFSFAGFSKKAGAYEEEQPCKACSFSLLKDWVEEKNSVGCEFIQEKIPEPMFTSTNFENIMAAVKSGNGIHVINMQKNIADVNDFDDALIVQAVKQAENHGEVSVFFTGPSKASPRTLSSSFDNREVAASSTVLILMNPEVFFGLLFLASTGILLIFVMCCCMDAIEPQSKFAKSYPLRGKEQN